MRHGRAVIGDDAHQHGDVGLGREEVLPQLGLSDAEHKVELLCAVVEPRDLLLPGRQGEAELEVVHVEVTEGQHGEADGRKHGVGRANGAGDPVTEVAELLDAPSGGVDVERMGDGSFRVRPQHKRVDGVDASFAVEPLEGLQLEVHERVHHDQVCALLPGPGELLEAGGHRERGRIRREDHPKVGGTIRAALQDLAQGGMHAGDAERSEDEDAECEGTLAARGRQQDAATIGGGVGGEARERRG